MLRRQYTSPNDEGWLGLGKQSALGKVFPGCLSENKGISPKIYGKAYKTEGTAVQSLRQKGLAAFLCTFVELLSRKTTDCLPLIFHSLVGVTDSGI